MSESLILLASLGLFYLASKKKPIETVVPNDDVPVQPPYSQFSASDRFMEDQLRDGAMHADVIMGPRGIPVIQYSAPGGRHKYVLSCMNSIML